MCFFRLSLRWIGFCLIAILEILELIALLIYRSCAKLQQKNIKVQPAVDVAVLTLHGTSFGAKNNLEDTQTIDEIVLVK
jgi:hypothetical protein